MCGWVQIMYTCGHRGPKRGRVDYCDKENKIARIDADEYKSDYQKQWEKRRVETECINQGVRTEHNPKWKYENKLCLTCGNKNLPPDWNWEGQHGKKDTWI